MSLYCAHRNTQLIGYFLMMETIYITHLKYLPALGGQSTESLINGLTNIIHLSIVLRITYFAFKKTHTTVIEGS